MSDQKSPKTKPRWWTPYWLAIVITTVIIAVALPIIRRVPWETAAIILLVVLIFEGLAYYARVKPSVNLNSYVHSDGCADRICALVHLMVVCSKGYVSSSWARFSNCDSQLNSVFWHRSINRRIHR